MKNWKLMSLMHFCEVDDRTLIPSAMTALSSILLVLQQRFSNPFSRNRLALKGPDRCEAKSTVP